MEAIDGGLAVGIPRTCGAVGGHILSVYLDAGHLGRVRAHEESLVRLVGELIKVCVGCSSGAVGIIAEEWRYRSGTCIDSGIDLDLAASERIVRKNHVSPEPRLGILEKVIGGLIHFVCSLCRTVSGSGPELAVRISWKSVEELHEIEGRAGTSGERSMPVVRGAVGVNTVSHGRIAVLPYENVLRGGKVFPHIHHVLVLGLPVACLPGLLVERVLAGVHDLAGSLVGLGEPFLRKFCGLALLEADHAHASLLSKPGEASGDCLIVLGDRSGIKHCLGLVCEGDVLVGIASLAGSLGKKFGGLCEVGADLLPGLLLGGTRKFHVVRILRVVVNLLDCERHSAVAAGHLIEDESPYEISLAEEFIVLHLGVVIAPVVRKGLDEVVRVVHAGECLIPVCIVLAHE